MARNIELVDPPRLTPGEKLREAIRLQALGVAMKRAALRREDPDASEAEIDERLFRWRARLE